jgi:hypothetical protein
MTTTRSIRLNLSPVVAFDVKFALNDGGERREFGFRAEADRVPPLETETIGSYLADRAKLRMVRWLNDASPLKDAETDADTPAGTEALAALFEHLPSMHSIVFEQLLQAMQAKPIPGPR